MVSVRNLITYETWKDIIGFEGLYQISDFGNVKSLLSSPLRFKFKNNIMTPQLSRKINGYLKVMLRKNGKSYSFKIHKLVSSHFKIKDSTPKNSLCSDNYVINHIDGDTLNNNVSNLELCTQKYNVYESIKRGTHVMPDWRAMSKLKEKDVIEMRRVYTACRGNITYTKLGNMYNVSRVHASRVIRKVCWGDI